MPWRPVLKQVLPWRSLNSAAEIDPERKPPVRRSIRGPATAPAQRFWEVRLRALAVLLLIASSNLVGCETGYCKLDAMAPFKSERSWERDA